MTNEEILEKQVEALEKLLQLKEAIIAEQEAKIQKMEMERINNPLNVPYIPGIHQPMYPQPQVFIPSVWTHDPCPKDNGQHEYPNPWFATTPPPCNKCGKSAPSTGATFTTISGDADNSAQTIEPINGIDFTLLNLPNKAK